VPAAARLKSLALNVTLMVGATVATLALLDGLLIVTGLFPPTYRYGDGKVGWLAAPGSGQMERATCVDLASGAPVEYVRNEDGVRTARTARELRKPDSTYRVGVGGDSHTDLCVTNDRAHFGVTERMLMSSGHAATVFAFGAGRYSPLQAYLALEAPVREYHANALVLNVYTGNDFYDMLRIDDRPHLVPVDTGYTIAPPVWYEWDQPGVRRHSRVRYALRLITDATGLRRVYLRLRYLRDVASEQGRGTGTVLAYLADLRAATAEKVGYPQAYTAQMLNQQLFFHHFPAGRAESVQRMRALLRYIRMSHPGLLLVLSPIPSYRLMPEAAGDSSFRAVLGRLPVTMEDGIREEEALYESLRAAASEEGWAFVDNLPALREYRGAAPLFNAFDLHIEPVASELIGRSQASVIGAAIAERR